MRLLKNLNLKLTNSEMKLFRKEFEIADDRMDVFLSSNEHERVYLQIGVANQVHAYAEHVSEGYFADMDITLTPKWFEHELNSSIFDDLEIVQLMRMTLSNYNNKENN